MLFAQDFKPASSLHCPRIDRTLQFGSRDSTASGQVSELQRFLSDWYDLDPGAYVTGYFGRLTRENVRRFQCERMNICSGDEASTGWGVVGPRTKVAITSACSGGSAPPPPATPQTATPTPPPAQSTLLPIVSITVDDQEYVELDPRVIYTVNWSSTNASSCTLRQSFGTNAPSEARVEPGTRGSARGLVPLEGSVTYTLTCSNAKGSSEKSATAKRKPGAPCSAGGITLQDRETGTFYSASSVVAPQSCVSESRTCNDGILSGSPQYSYNSCTVASSATSNPAPAPSPSPSSSSGASVSCAYNGQSYPEGQSVAASGLTATCDNGEWVGPSSDTIPFRTVCFEGGSCSQSPPFGFSPRHGRAPLGVTAYAYVKMGFYICAAHTISWGDGTSDSYPRTQDCTQDGAMSVRAHGHTYSSPGSYTAVFSSEMYTTTASVHVRVDP